MKLTHGAHLAYCTNVHRGSDWPETLQSLATHVLAVRRRVCPDRPFAIGLRLSDAASRELAVPETLQQFRNWLLENQCYVFTINGFPFGNFHGTRVKELVSQPDWSHPARLEYTLRLFDILSELLPEGLEGSVSTVPVSFKQFNLTSDQLQLARRQLWACVEHLDGIRTRKGVGLHLGLEPEPFGTVENTDEFLELFLQMRNEHRGDNRLQRHLGINYDTCHFALQYEAPDSSLSRLLESGVRVSKLHLSNALRVRPTPEVLKALVAFEDGVYFHQVIERRGDGTLMRYPDLDLALLAARNGQVGDTAEWRVHFHIPLHAPEGAHWGTTADHLRGTMAFLGQHPRLCQHLEMETYTWEVLPAGWRDHSVEEMLAKEYRWTLEQLDAQGFRPIESVIPAGK